MRIRLGSATALLVAGVIGGAQAADLPEPSGRVVLTVTGAIENMNGDGFAAFDREMLEDLDWRDIQTHTSFTQGTQEFAGPTLASLLQAVGAEGATLKATAINDYFVEIPSVHADAHNVLLALDMNGTAMRIRDKGPVWVIYPLSEEETASKPFDTEMIWQLNRIEVQD